jgi:hypothetical protein
MALTYTTRNTLLIGTFLQDSAPNHIHTLKRRRHLLRRAGRPRVRGRGRKRGQTRPRCPPLPGDLGHSALDEPGTFCARNVFLLAAAAGTEVFETLRLAAGHVHVLYTRNDKALGRWYWLFEWESALGYAGLPRSESALGRWPNVTAVDCSGAVTNHHDYHAAPSVLNYLAHAIRSKAPKRHRANPNMLTRTGTGYPRLYPPFRPHPLQKSPHRVPAQRE